MSICESKDQCSFFTNEMDNTPSLVRVMRRRYCESDKEHCARYMIKQMLYKGYTLRDEKVLSELERDLSAMYPNDLYKAQSIIRQMDL